MTVAGIENLEKFTDEQKKVIEMGLLNNVDVKHYAKTEFTSEQMAFILLGLLNGLDVAEYAKSEFTTDEMSKIWQRLMLKKIYK